MRPRRRVLERVTAGLSVLALPAGTVGAQTVNKRTLPLVEEQIRSGRAAALALADRRSSSAAPPPSK